MCGLFALPNASKLWSSVKIKRTLGFSFLEYAVEILNKKSIS